jgi:hypothetical protein
MFSRNVDFPAPGGPDNPEIDHKVNKQFCFSQIVKSKPHFITDPKTE